MSASQIVVTYTGWQGRLGTVGGILTGIGREMYGPGALGKGGRERGSIRIDRMDWLGQPGAGGVPKWARLR
jgi:hypothetical protein